MRSPHLKDIRRAQKESVLYKELSRLFLAITFDEKNLGGLSLTRVKLSDDGGVCVAFFYSANGLKEFDEKLSTLVLYRASLRKALAKSVPARYTPELIFKFDEQFDKQQRIDQLLQSIKDKDRA